MLFRKNAAEFHGRTQFAPTVGTFPVGFVRNPTVLGRARFFSENRHPFVCFADISPVRGIIRPYGLRVAVGIAWDSTEPAGANAYGSRVTTGLSKKRREQAPALRILHLRLAYHTSMPSFFAARRVKSSRASRQNVKPKSAPIVTSVRKCLPIIMRVKPSSHV